MMPLEIPPGPFDAYLFDLDGTLADTMPLHFVAWNQTLARWNTHFPTDLFYGWAGTPTVRIVEMMNTKFGLSMPPEEVAHLKEEAFFELLPQVKAIPSVLAHVEMQRGQLPLAIVSGGTHSAVIRTLQALQLEDAFGAIVTAESTPRGKPAPDPFLRAAEILGISPERCLVFEDAELGIQAAQAARMQWVRVPTQAVPSSVFPQKR
jgi:HAD superfamily hydrolase (TIGR01509 family)